MNMLDHLESFLGQTEGGWKDPPGESWPFYVMEFSGGPVPKTSTFCTVGLCEYPLKQCCNVDIRLELMLVVQDIHGPMSIPALLHDIGVEAMSEQRAFARGEVIGPRGPLFPDSKLEAIYVTEPLLLPAEFNDIKTTDGEHGLVAWLMPITRKEAEFIHANGWDSFEEMLVEHQPNVFDMFRGEFIP